MRFVVLGSGAIGAFVGASLFRGGIDVELIARGERFAAMQANGIRVMSRQNEFTVRPPITDDWSKVAEADVVFLGVKAYSLPEIAPRLGASIASGTTIIAAQNGIPWWYFQSFGGPFEGLVLQSVDPNGVISSAMPAGGVIGCVAYCSTEMVEPGVIWHQEGTRFSIGEPDRTVSSRCHEISAVFQAGGLKAPVERDLRNEIWLKLLGNATFNPVSALTGATLGELGEVPEMRAMLSAAFREIADVAHQIGVSFPVPLERRLEGGFQVGGHKTSMLQDMELGKRLEYQCMTGAIIELAQLLKIDVPRIATLHACVHTIDSVRARREILSQ